MSEDSNKVPCKKCGNLFSKTGVARHEKNCTGEAKKPKTPAKPRTALKTSDFSQLENAPIIQQILLRLDRLERGLSRATPSPRPQETEKISMEQGVFDDVILGIYREIRARPNQAVPIAQVWARLSSRHPDITASAFTRLLLKSSSPKFHLEQGTGEFQVKDPTSGKIFGYLIGS